jgi:predicted MFS family arabinose efflux permease
MTQQLGANPTQASAALAAFWAMVTVGRVLFAALGRWVPGRVAYHGLPFVLVAAFATLTLPSSGDVTIGIALFALAGLGCSALLPLTISIGQEAISSMSAAFAGGVIAFYEVGYGLAAFGVGPLLNSGRSLSEIYGFGAVVAASMGVLSFAVAHRRRSPASLHPRPWEADPSRPATIDRHAT